jgi:hypothetical protein
MMQSLDEGVYAPRAVEDYSDLAACRAWRSGGLPAAKPPSSVRDE